MKFSELLKNPMIVVFSIGAHGRLRLLKDETFLKLMYRCKFWKKLNLDNPQTFNEKIQWLKLYDRKPEYTTMVDKYEAKKYVADKIGEQYIIPTLGVWDRFDDIDFDKLPDHFVLKCTHDSGSLVIVKNKLKFDKVSAKKKLEKALNRNYYWVSREWAYKNVQPRIIAEKYMESPSKIVPEDYKVYCMNGEPKYIVVFHNRFNTREKLSETVYNTTWERQNISLDEHFSISNDVEPKPKCLGEMLEIAGMLSKDMSQVRIDFYIVDSKLYFGEITLSTAGGFQKMIPEDTDLKLGKMLKINI